ncbi:MAG TPA: FHA domain-containing protein [Methanospirillum sp.]|nr:FHA domain-containing protein [Methanospirillum sp.]
MISDKAEAPEERTILTVSDPEFISDLSEYLDVLGSQVRLHILSYVGTRSRTVRQISQEIETSYENTKKHLTRLQSLGLIRKEIGVSDEPANQGQPVFYYSLVPGGLDHTVSNLALFSSVAGKSVSGLSDRLESARVGLQGILPSAGPRLILTTGYERGRPYDLTGELVRIGRTEEGWDGSSPEPAILIPDEYRSVSRVSRPHAWLRVRSGRWTIADGTSKGGTSVNGVPVSHEPTVLRNGDLIELSPGSLGASLLFQAGKS